MKDLQRNPKLKNSHFGLLAKTLKSGPEAAKPGNYPPGPDSVFVWRVERKVISGCMGLKVVLQEPHKYCFKRKVGTKV